MSVVRRKLAHAGRMVLAVVVLAAAVMAAAGSVAAQSVPRFTLVVAEPVCTRDLLWRHDFRIENISATDTLNVAVTFEVSNQPGTTFGVATYTLAPGQSVESGVTQGQGAAGGTIQFFGADGRDTVSSGVFTLPDCLLTSTCDCETVTPGITCRSQEAAKASTYAMRAEKEANLACFKVRRLASGRFVISACSTSQATLDRIFKS